MAQVHVLTGPERRRRFSDAEKRAMVAAAFAPGAVVADVARQADVCPSLIYRWRQELGAPSGGFAEVKLAPLAAAAEGEHRGDAFGERDGPGAPACLAISGSGESGHSAAADTAVASIEVEVAGGARARIPASIPAELASAVIAALLRR